MFEKKQAWKIILHINRRHMQSYCREIDNLGHPKSRLSYTCVGCIEACQLRMLKRRKKRIHEMAETEELKVFKLKTQNSFCGISGF